MGILSVYTRINDQNLLSPPNRWIVYISCRFLSTEFPSFERASILPLPEDKELVSFESYSRPSDSKQLGIYKCLPNYKGGDTMSGLMWGTRKFPLGPLVKIYPTSRNACSGTLLAHISQPSFCPYTGPRLSRTKLECRGLDNREPDRRLVY